MNVAAALCVSLALFGLEGSPQRFWWDPGADLQAAGAEVADWDWIDFDLLIYEEHASERYRWVYFDAAERVVFGTHGLLWHTAASGLVSPSLWAPAPFRFAVEEERKREVIARLRVEFEGVMSTADSIIRGKRGFRF